MSWLAVCYGFSRRLQDEANANGRNYWYAYVEEILSRLGVSAQPLQLDDCADPSALERVGVLVLGNFPLSSFLPGATRVLADWVNAGGVLIGFATEGLDELFGVKCTGIVEQTRGPFSINGYFQLHESDVTAGCRPDIDPEQKLVIVSPVRLVHSTNSRRTARLFRCDEARPDDGALAKDAHAAAITDRPSGLGHAFYFAFNVAQTMWTIQQGRPVDRDYDNDGYLRISDACVLGNNSLRVPYCDVLHFLLANMIGRRPVPMIHQIPPRENRAAPCLLCFGGDDECDPNNQVVASDFMAERALPYHINAMPIDGKFAIDKRAQEHIEANGHEIALHYNFMDGFKHPVCFTPDDVVQQARLFRETFGRDSVCGVNHWCRWTGWAEPARWMRAAGSRADNSYINWTSPPLNPVNTLGFAFGSSFPRYFWDDAGHHNVRIDLVEIPIVAYEVGYLREEFRPEKLHQALALARNLHLTMNFFWHPVYVATHPAYRHAIDELVGLMNGMPVPPVLMGSRAFITHARRDCDCVSFRAECNYRDGFVVKVPTGAAPAKECSRDGSILAFESAFEFGQYWAYIPLAGGSHALQLVL